MSSWPVIAALSLPELKAVPQYMYPPEYYEAQRRWEQQARGATGATGPTELDYGWPQQAGQQNRKGFMRTMTEDIKAFIAEHRKIIYFVVILLIIDRFFLKRALENRIRQLAEKLLGTVENKLHALTGAPSAAPVPVVIVPSAEAPKAP